MRRTGFTLIELIVASAVFASVLLVGFTILANTTAVQSKISGQRAVGETARFSLEGIAREVRLANGIVSRDARGILVQTAPPFEILPGSTAGQNSTNALQQGDKQGSEIKIMSTDVATGQTTIKLIGLAAVTGDDNSTVVHQQIVMKTCTDQTCTATLGPTVLITPKDFEVADLQFSGLTIDPAQPFHQPFVKIELSLKRGTAFDRAEETASYTLETIVTPRNYQLIAS